MKRPTWRRFAPPSQVPPISFSLSFSFQFPFNLNYETKRLKTGSRTSTTNKKQRTKKNCKKQSVSQKIDLVMRIQTVQKSSKSELSSVTFGRVKVYKKRAKHQKSQLWGTPIRDGTGLLINRKRLDGAKLDGARDFLKKLPKSISEIWTVFKLVNKLPKN